MSDSDGDDDREERLNFKKKRLHFGSLEVQEREKLESGTTKDDEGKEDEEKMIEFKVGPEISHTSLQLKEASDDEKDKGEEGHIGTVVDEYQQEMWEEFEKRKKARHIAVPTEDIKVKAMFREMEQPVCLFGEGPYERRERLKTLLVESGKDSGVVTHKEELKYSKDEEDEEEEDEDKPEVWYHEGTGDLKRARFFIADYSTPRAKDRLDQTRSWAVQPETTKNAQRQEVHNFTHNLNNECSQIGDLRPLSYCSISPCSQYLATGSWSGLIKLWTLPNCNPLATLAGHNGRVGAVVFSPQAGISLSPEAACLVSCDSDGVVNLWNMKETKPVGELPGHNCRVSRINYHPSGRFLGTTCFDHSWRLWDLERHAEILHQEGHSGPVYALAFHGDGSLLATGGLDSYSRIWDLRTGRNVLFLEGHLKSVLSCDFAPDGYHLATGSEDHSTKIWDLRMHKCIYTIPAHNNMITFCKFAGTVNSSMLLTASYDGTAKIWSHKGWMPLKSLTGHDNKVMCVDCSWDKKYIVTASYDRTFKLWRS